MQSTQKPSQNPIRRLPTTEPTKDRGHEAFILPISLFADEEAVPLVPASSVGVEVGVDIGMVVFPSAGPVGPTLEPVLSMPLDPGSNPFGVLLGATAPVTDTPPPADSEPVVVVVYGVPLDVIIILWLPNSGDVGSIMVLVPMTRSAAVPRLTGVPESIIPLPPGVSVTPAMANPEAAATKLWPAIVKLEVGAGNGTVWEAKRKGIVLVPIIIAEGLREMGIPEIVTALPLGKRVVDAREKPVGLGVNVCSSDVRGDRWFWKGTGSSRVPVPSIRPLEAKKAGVPLIVTGGPLRVRVFEPRTKMDGAG